MVEQVVGLRFVVEGEREATAKLKTFNNQQEKLSNNIKTGAGIAQRLENDIRKLSDAYAKGTIGQRAYNESITNVTRAYKVLNEGVRGTSMSIQKATADVQRVKRAIDEERQSRERLIATQQRAETAFALAMQKHQEEEAASKRLAAEKIKLEAMYNRTATAARIYEQAVESLNRAEELGVINADKKAAELQQLNAAYAQVGSSANNTTRFINQYGEGARIAGVKTNRFGLYAQQVGYQVGDFFVQVQSGTNAFVAFGQQATQLAGLLPGLAGAIVGIGISLGTMLLAGWSRTRDAAKEAASGIEDFTSALQEANRFSEINRSTIEDLRAEYGMFAEDAKELSQFLSEVAVSRAFDALNTESSIFLNGVSDAVLEITKLRDAIDNIDLSQFQFGTELYQTQIDAIELLQSDIESMANSLGLTEDQVISLGDAFRDLQSQSTMEGVAQSASNALKMIEGMAFESGKIPPELAKAVEQIEKIFAAAARTTDSTVQMASSFQAALSLVRQITGVDLASAFDDAANSVSEMNARLNLTLGRLGNILSAIGSIGFDTVAKRAEAEALRSGLSREQAQIEGRLAMEAERLSSLSTTERGLALTALRSALEENAAEQANLNAEIEKYNERNKEASGSARQLTEELTEQEKAAAELAKTLEDMAVNAVGNVANAFADLVMRGFRDFKSFTQAIIESFRNMLTEMIALAARNRIMVSLGLGGTATQAMAGAVSGGGGIMGMFGGFTQGFFEPFTVGIKTAMEQGLSQGWNAFSTMANYNVAMGGVNALGAYAGAGLAGFGIGQAISGGYSVIGKNPAAATGAGTAIGMIIGGPVGGLIGGVIGGITNRLFGRKTTDAGLTGEFSASNFSAQQYEFQKGGLFRSDRTVMSAADQGLVGGISKAWMDVRKFVTDAAMDLGVGVDAFSRFSREFKVSLMGMSDEEAVAAIQAELQKAGDAFAALIPNIQNLEQLTAVMNERVALETRLLQLQGNVVELRRRELEAVNEYNRDLLRQIYAEQDRQAAEQKAQSIAQEREGLETRILQLQENTAELRRRELEALDPTNRSLQQFIYTLEDARRELDAINEIDFATRVDFLRAQGRARAALSATMPAFANGGYHSGGMRLVGERGPELEVTGPSRIYSARQTGAMIGGGDDVRRELAELKIVTMQNAKYIKRTYDIYRKWDVDGLPAERT